MHLFSTLNDRQPSYEGTALFVRELQSFFVADPQVDTTSSGIHPQKVFVPELIAECAIKDAYCSSDELPAAFADIGSGAACTDRVVVRHINVENELAQLRRECSGANSLLISWLERHVFRQNHAQSHRRGA